MGVAIHLVIETQSKNGRWVAITDDMWVPRDWDLFGAIAFGDDGDGRELPYPPRGFPANHSIGSRLKYFDTDKKFLRIFSRRKMGIEEITAPSKIKKLLKGDKVHEEVYNKYGLLPGEWITGTSWLNLSELEEAMVYKGIKDEAMSKEFQKVLLKMSRAAKKLGKEKVRIVFWFDH